MFNKLQMSTSRWTKKPISKTMSSPIQETFTEDSTPNGKSKWTSDHQYYILQIFINSYNILFIKNSVFLIFT